MKRLVAFLLVAIMAFGLASCGETKADFGSNVSLKVWGAEKDQEMLAQMIESFKAEYSKTTWDITLGIVGEPDAYARYSEDPAAAADVFAFANDQLNDFTKSKGLYEVAGTYKDFVTKNNGEGSVGALTSDGKIYGFPMTADNGYFMYYDKSVITDTSSLDKMLEQAGNAGKKVFMDVSNGWYIASFFLGGGGKLEIDAEGNQSCDFNNETGVKVGEAIKAFTANSAFMTGDDSVLTGGMGTTNAAGVGGTWNAEAIKEALGDNYAACKLPTFTLDGKQVQMSSFGGYKAVGVNRLTANPDAAMALAQWLTNEANQLMRFEMRGMGPSNTNAAKNAKVLADPALAALAAQGAYATSQNDVGQNYWGPAEAFGAAMESKDYSASVQEQLTAMVNQITSK